MIYEQEVWKTIEGFEDYQVSTYGKIKSFKHDKINGKILEPYKNRDGHFQIKLQKDGKGKNKYIHRLLFETFNDYKLKYNECIHHVDEIPDNNYIENIKLMTISEHRKYHMSGEKNTKSMLGKTHSEKTKKLIRENHVDNKGEKNGNSTLTERNVIRIKIDLYEGILNQREISEKYKVKQPTISDIKTGKLWNHIKI